MAEYVLMLVCGLSGVVYSQVSEPWRLVILIGWGGIYAGLAYGVQLVERHHYTNGRVGGEGPLSFN